MRLEILSKDRLEEFKKDMQKAFRQGAIDGMGLDEEVLPERDIDHSLNEAGAVACIALDNDEMLGGALVVIDEESKNNHLDFLYVKIEAQGKGVGKYIWNEIEKKHPDTKVWATCTPYFDKRNIHFYINNCGFYATKFYNKFYPDPNHPEDVNDEYFDGMFEFEKRME